jgi:hypothetical protein
MLFGQFLVMYKKESVFISWLIEETGMKAKSAKTISKCLLDWANTWI